jgi:5'-nucleotidase
MGDFIADIYAEITGCDVILIGSGTLRVKEFGPVVTLGELKEMIPYADSYLCFLVKGEKLLKIFSHFLRTENCNNDGECFQVNHNVKAIYSKNKDHLETLLIRGEPVQLDMEFSLGIQGFHFQNSKANLDVSQEELLKLDGKKVVTSSFISVVEEYLHGNHVISCPEVEGRLVYID